MCFESSLAVDKRVNPILSGRARKRKSYRGKYRGPWTDNGIRQEQPQRAWNPHKDRVPSIPESTEVIGRNSLSCNS